LAGCEGKGYEPALEVVHGVAYEIYYGINSAGEIVGSYTDKSGNSHGFLRRGTTYASIDFPGAAATYAAGVNDLAWSWGRIAQRSSVSTLLKASRVCFEEWGIYCLRNSGRVCHGAGRDQ
jgi:hypothetical protein